MTTVLAGMSAAVLALAPITSPIGGLAAFAGFAVGNASAAVRSQAQKTDIYVFAVLTVFAISGLLIMRFFGLDLSPLQIAGGLVVAHSGFSMLENKRRVTCEETQYVTPEPDVFFSPVAFPPITGPGSIGVVIALIVRNTAIGLHVDVVLEIVVTAAVIVLLLRYGTPWIDKPGATSVGTIARIMGFLILIISVEFIIHGVRTLQLF